MKQIRVGLVVFPGFQLLDIAGPKDAFAEVAVLSRGECVYEMLTVGTTRGTVTSSSGLAIVPDCSIFDPSPDFDLVIMPGGHGIFDAYDNPALSAWLEQQYRRDRRVAAICNGIFALGAAGLIDNRAVTTHWMDVPRLAATVLFDHRERKIYARHHAGGRVDAAILDVDVVGFEACLRKPSAASLRWTWPSI